MSVYSRAVAPGTPPLLSGRFEFGWPDFHHESLQAMSTDPRWETDCLEVVDDRALLGALQLSWPRRPGLPKGLLGDRVRAVLGARTDQAERVLVVGGTARYLGGGLVRARTDPWSSPAILEDLVGRAARRAAGQGETFVALSVPHDQVPMFQHAGGPAIRSAPGQVWAGLRLGGARTMDEFVGSLPRQVRYNWRRDTGLLETSGLELAVESWDDALLDEAAGQIADVSARNGVNDDPLMVRWRLDQWRAQTLGEHVFLTARDHGELVGACATRIGGDVVDAFEIGLHPEHVHRHVAYVALIFRSTVLLALEHAADRIELGVGHSYPKAQRGASLTRLWDLHASQP